MRQVQSTIAQHLRLPGQAIKVLDLSQNGGLCGKRSPNGLTSGSGPGFILLRAKDLMS